MRKFNAVLIVLGAGAAVVLGETFCIVTGVRIRTEGIYNYGQDAILVCGEAFVVNDNAPPDVLRRRFEALLERRGKKR